MKLFPLLALFLCCITTLQAQNLISEQTYGTARLDNAPRLVAVDDGYVFCGNTQGTVDDNPILGDIWLVKVDSQGSMMWEQRYGGFDADIANGFHATSDNGFIICGQTYSVDVMGGSSVMRGLGDAWIIKTDGEGNVEWQKSYGGSQPDMFFDVRQTPDQGYIAVGYTMSNDYDVSSIHGGGDMWLVKLDGFGNIQWEATFGGTDHEIAHSVEITASGDYIIAGSASSNDGQVSGFHGGSKDAWVIKVSSMGGLIWQKTYGGSDLDDLWRIKEVAPGNNYLLVGESHSNDGDVFSNHGKNDMWFLKIDGAGQILSSRLYGGSEDEGAYDAVELSGGTGFVIAGFTYSYDGDVKSKTDSFSADAWVIMTNSVGDMTWERNYGGSGRDVAYSVLQYAPSAFIFSAGTSSEDGDVSVAHGDVDCWLVRILSAISPNAVSGIYGRNDLKLYPTVTSGRLFIEQPEIGTSGLLRIYDMTGRVCLQRILRAKKEDIYMNLSAGSYIAEVRSGNRTVRKQLMVQ